jgi:hypothetical protein
MKHKQVQKSKRLALFSEYEQNYLKNKIHFDSVQKSKLHHHLDLRFDSLLKDLDLLRRSKNLSYWRSLRSWKYRHYFDKVNYFSNLFSDVRQGYSSALRRVVVGKSKKSFYWLDHSPLKISKIDPRIFNSNYLFRHIRVRLTDSDKTLFLQAFHNGGVLPIMKEDAITINEIKKRISGESKIRTNEKQITLSKDTFKDPRNYEIAKTIFKYEKKINTVLDKYDSKLTRWNVDASFHPE